MKDIQRLEVVQDFVKKEVQRLLSLAESPQEEHGEISDEEENFSDFSVDHHPNRTCRYTLTFAGSDDEEEEDRGEQVEDDGEEDRGLVELEDVSQEEWVIDGHCISDLCFDLKESTVKLIKRTDPSQLSDIRLLLLNDIFMFDRNSVSSVSKYFSTKVHTLLKPTLIFQQYLPPRGMCCYEWCLGIEASPPVDWLSSLTLCSRFLPNACESKNVVDLHTAQILTQILPVLVDGPPDDANEDSFVHCYLSPLLSSVFASHPLLKMKWANGKLIKDKKVPFKPDFLVYNITGSAKCVILVAEFKPTEKNSYVESDLVKLGKQMKETLNKLVKDGVNKPKVCSVLCEGEDLLTYVMDLPSPKLYRMVNSARTKLFKGLEQISLLPNLVTHLLCLKAVVSETATKVETASLFSQSSLKRPAADPPVSWLSWNKVILSRIAKKIK